jgi:predicted transcriptional regulator
MEAYIVYPTKEQEKAVEAFFEALEVSFEKKSDSDKLPDHVINGIAEGEADFEAGRVTTMDEFKKKLLMFK